MIKRGLRLRFYNIWYIQELDHGFETTRYCIMAIPDFLNTTLPLLSFRVRGEWQKTKIFQVIRGKQIIRDYTAYDGSAKYHLKPFQSKFAAAVWNWQHMPYSERRFYIARAAKLGLQISGYNYFISLYLQDKLEDYPMYPDPHKLSHQKGGADELDLTDLVGTTPRAILGDSTSGRVLRKTWLGITDGSIANSIAVELVARWNGDSIAKIDNILKGATGVLSSLSADGQLLTLKSGCFTGDVVSVLSSDLLRNQSGVPITVGYNSKDGGIEGITFQALNGVGQDLTVLVDVGNILVSVVYVTSE